MVKAGQISKGMFLKVKNEPVLVADREFVNPGKGSSFVRLKLKSLKTGLVKRVTVKSHEMVEDIIVEYNEAQFLYSDADSYHFMDNETYEQFAVDTEGLEDRKKYLKEGDVFQLMVWEDRPIDIVLPKKMAFKVTHAEHAIRGDTVSGTTKPVTIETGIQIKVPIFIKQGDKILVNTETGEYVERTS